MTHRTNINPRAHLNFNDIDSFEKVLNPSKDSVKREKWLDEYDEAFLKYLVSDVNIPMNMKKRFCVLLMIYPMKENEEKTYFRLDKNGKVGYLSKFLIKKAHSCKVPKPVIDHYLMLKKGVKMRKQYSSMDSQLVSKSDFSNSKNELQSYTYMLLETCYSKNTRSGKLDALLDD